MTIGAVIEVAAGMYEPGVVIRQTGPDGTWFGIGAYDETIGSPVLRHDRDSRRCALGEMDEARGQCRRPSSILNLPLAEAVKTGMQDLMKVGPGGGTGMAWVTSWCRSSQRPEGECDRTAQRGADPLDPGPR